MLLWYFNYSRFLVFDIVFYSILLLDVFKFYYSFCLLDNYIGYWRGKKCYIFINDTSFIRLNILFVNDESISYFGVIFGLNGEFRFGWVGEKFRKIKFFYRERFRGK